MDAEPRKAPRMLRRLLRLPQLLSHLATVVTENVRGTDVAVIVMLKIVGRAMITEEIAEDALASVIVDMATEILVAAVMTEETEIDLGSVEAIVHMIVALTTELTIVVSNTRVVTKVPVATALHMIANEIVVVTKDMVEVEIEIDRETEVIIGKFLTVALFLRFDLFLFLSVVNT